MNVERMDKDEYRKMATEMFNEYVSRRDWQSVQELFLELQDNKAGDLEPKLIDTMSSDELEEFSNYVQQESE